MKVEKVTNAMRTVLPVKACGAVIVAAGASSRMGSTDKIMAILGGEPVISRTVRAFECSSVISEIVIVTRQDLILPIRDLCAQFKKVKAVVAGGDTRTDSVRAGLRALSKKMKLAAIHDGARPLISREVIDRTVRAAHTYGAAAPVVAVKDTVKEVRGGLIAHTPDREFLRAVQTPQVFDCALLSGALNKAEKENAALTDDCAAVENLGMKVKTVPGDEHNIKITTPIDLMIAERLLEDML